MAFDIVVVGTSSGGLRALTVLLSGLPPEFPLPVVVAQHRGKDSELALAEYLGRHSSLPVSEPDDKEKIVAGRVYLAPRDYHLLIESDGFALSTDPPVVYARPSIDVLFESAADVYHERVIGVILTGGSRDGSHGLARIKARGGITFVEDPKTAGNREMPDAAIAATSVDEILPLHEIALRLQKLTDSVGQYV